MSSPTHISAPANAEVVPPECAIVLTFPTSDSSPCSLLEEVAGVPLLHRCLITGQRAGIQRFYLAGQPDEKITASLSSNPKITASWAWLENSADKIATELISSPPLVVISAFTLIHAKVWKSFVQAANIPCCAYHGSENLWFALGKFDRLPADTAAWQAWFSQLPLQELAGFAYVMTPHKKQAEQALLYSYASSMDGLVDVYVNRPAGRFMILPLVRWHVSPNAVTVVSILVGLVSAFLFLDSGYWPTVIAALLLQLSAVIDCMDGDIARLPFRESTLGKWLDLAGDNVVHVALFSCLMLREYWLQGNSTPLILGAMLVIGTILAFALVVYAQTALPKLSQSKQVSSALDRLHGWIDKMTNRDFTVLLILGAIWGNLYWFLWLAALGTQFFWLTLLIYILVIRWRVQR